MEQKSYEQETVENSEELKDILVNETEHVMCRNPLVFNTQVFAEFKDQEYIKIIPQNSKIITITQIEVIQRILNRYKNVRAYTIEYNAKRRNLTMNISVTIPKQKEETIYTTSQP